MSLIGEAIGAMVPAYVFYKLFRWLIWKVSGRAIPEALCHMSVVVFMTALGTWGRGRGNATIDDAIVTSFVVSALAQGAVATLYSLNRLRKRTHAD